MKAFRTALELREDGKKRIKDEVVSESPLTISVNGQHLATAMVTPEKRKEFVVGHLFSEGIIDSLDKIKLMEINEKEAKVIADIREFVGGRTILSGCGSASNLMSKLPRIKSGLKIKRKVMMDAVSDVLRSGSSKRTGGYHRCAAFSASGKLFSAEDVGRHNALDKVIGAMLLKKCNFSRTFVVSTGRISSDMVLKCSRANIPIVASKGATTSLAVDIAKKTGLTVVGFVRGGRMNVYCGAGRVI
jgi:FdhD protein